MYSPELIKEIKEIFPTWAKINELAVQGKTELGLYLNDQRETPEGVLKLLLEEIITINSPQDLQAVQAKAVVMKRKIDLYYAWKKENKQFATLLTS